MKKNPDRVDRVAKTTIILLFIAYCVFTIIKVLIFFADVPPFLDISKPIYVIADSSFFKDCNNNVKCRESRLEAAREGAEEWTRWFKNTGMKIVIKTEVTKIGEKIAPNSLLLKIKKRVDEKNSRAITIIATFFKSSRSIVYNGSDYINQPEVFAHEIGHALGLNHSASKRSLMYYLWNDAAKHVYYRDAKEVCELHSECSRLDLIISLKIIRPIMRIP